MYKSQLQEYAQKAGLPAPIYEVKREGPSHEPQFKASVTFQGNTYLSPASFGNLKKAEHAAAEVALAAMGKSETGPLHESGLCKNLLQEYAQKCKLPLPVYSVVKTGDDQQSPSFVATVEVGGVDYEGQMCKTKKEAEIKAAKTALVAIYADSGNSFSQPVEDEKTPSKHNDSAAVEVTPSSETPSKHNDSAAVEVTPPSETKSGTKRKKLFKGGKEVRKQKVEDKKLEKVEETGNGDAKRTNGSSSPSGTADIDPTAGNLKGAACANGNELPVQCPLAQEQ